MNVSSCCETLNIHSKLQFSAKSHSCVQLIQSRYFSLLVLTCLWVSLYLVLCICFWVCFAFLEGLPWSFTKACICIQTLCDLLTEDFTNLWMLPQVLSAQRNVIGEQQLFAAILATPDKLSTCLQQRSPALPEESTPYSTAWGIWQEFFKMSRFPSELFFEQGD